MQRDVCDYIRLYQNQGSPLSSQSLSVKLQHAVAISVHSETKGLLTNVTPIISIKKKEASQRTILLLWTSLLKTRAHHIWI